jgi:DNA polymerase III delta prime subunit
VDLVRDIYNWADRESSPNIFWLSGLAGTGKSTIARTVARRYFNQNRLGASYFFSRTSRAVENSSKFVTSIAAQLADNIPALRGLVAGAILEHGDITSKPLRDQWGILVLSPLSKFQHYSDRGSLILVVDALDECEGDQINRIIPLLLVDARSLQLIRLRVFLSCRAEFTIQITMSHLFDADHEDFVLHDISQLVIDQDITVFLKHSLEAIQKERSLYPRSPGEEKISLMV